VRGFRADLRRAFAVIPVFLALGSGSVSFSGPTDPFVLRNTELSRPLSLRGLAVVKGRVFMVDQQQGRLLTFDGDRARPVATKGRGPGELERPGWLAVVGDKLYVKDFGRVHVFDGDGRFQEAHRYSPELDYVGPRSEGLVVLSGLGYGQLGNPLELVRLPFDSRERIRIASWAPERERNPRMRQTQPGVTKLGLERTNAWLSRDQRYAFVQVAGLNQVHIIDLARGETLEVIEVTGKPLPFDREAGLEHVASFNRARGSRLKGDFPTYFPLIERIVLTHEDRLIVIRSSGKLPKPNDNPSLDPDNFQVYDRHGKPSEPNVFDRNYWRVSWLDSHTVWFSIYNESMDEFTAVRVRRDEFESTVSRYPFFD